MKRQIQDAASDRIEYLNGLVNEREDRLEDLRTIIASKYNEHFPDALDGLIGHGANPLHPGNGLENIIFWCKTCRSPWPCDPWHEFRDLYVRTYGSRFTAKYKITMERVTDAEE